MPIFIKIVAFRIKIIYYIPGTKSSNRGAGKNSAVVFPRIGGMGLAVRSLWRRARKSQIASMLPSSLRYAGQVIAFPSSLYVSLDKTQDKNFRLPIDWKRLSGQVMGNIFWEPITAGFEI